MRKLAPITLDVLTYLTVLSASAAVLPRVDHIPTPPRFRQLMRSCPTPTRWKNSLFLIGFSHRWQIFHQTTALFILLRFQNLDWGHLFSCLSFVTIFKLLSPLYDTHLCGCSSYLVVLLGLIHRHTLLRPPQGGAFHPEKTSSLTCLSLLRFQYTPRALHSTPSPR